MTPEQATFLVGESTALMEREFPATCKVLAAVKEEGRDYKPDEKSRTAWQLAVHLATGDVWFLDSIVQGKFDWNPEGAKQAESQFKTVRDLVTFYEKAYPASLAKVKSLPAAQLTRTVDFFGMFQWPAVTFLGFAGNHGIHHRGQLAAYLRAMGSKVPAIYGGSADEPMPGV